MLHGGHVVPGTTAAQTVVAISTLVFSTIAPKVAESLGVEPVLVE
jgi:hypothetical protein